jgi:hypothetical protein
LSSALSVKFVTRMFLGEIHKFLLKSQRSAQPKLYLIMAFKAVMSFFIVCKIHKVSNAAGKRRPVDRPGSTVHYSLRT